MDRLLFEQVSKLSNIARRTMNGRGVNVPGFNTSAGIGSLPMPDRPAFFFIQVSSVDSSSPPAYSWTEVVRVNGVWEEPGDARSGTQSTFPAYEVTGSATAPQNTGSSTSAYPAWLSWDETSIEFAGIISEDGGGDGDSGGVATGARFSGVKVKPYYLGQLGSLGGLFTYWNVEIYDTENYWTAANSAYFTIPRDGWYHIGFSIEFSWGEGAEQGHAYAQMQKNNQIVPVVLISAHCNQPELYVPTYGQLSNSAPCQLVAGDTLSVLTSADQPTVFVLGDNFNEGRHANMWCYRIMGDAP